MKGFMPTINGRASRARTRQPNIRGTSERTYSTELSTESGVRGRPKDSKVESVKGRGGCFAYSSSRGAISAGEGELSTCTPFRPKLMFLSCCGRAAASRMIHPEPCKDETLILSRRRDVFICAGLHGSISLWVTRILNAEGMRMVVETKQGHGRL